MAASTQQSNLPAVLDRLPTVKSQVELSEALEQLKGHFNVLVPAQMNFSSPLHKVALEAVQLDATVDEKKNGIDIYSPDGSERYTLHYKAANKLAGAAGINWTKSYVAKRELGTDGRAIYVEHVVEWSVKKPNGSTKTGSTTGFYRFQEDKARHLPEKQIESRRRFAEALAESNAKLRAIFEALEHLPRHFTLAELKKPFLVPCVVQDVADLIKDDPEAKRMLLAHSLGITDQVYGQRQPQQLPATRTDEKDLTGRATATTTDEPEVNKQTGEIKVSEKEYKESWQRSSKADRVAQIEKLVKSKGYTPPTGSRSADALTDEQQVGYLWFLYQLPDAAKVTEAPLPWGGGQQ